MTLLPIAETAEAAFSEIDRLARTREDAARRAGGPVRLTAQELPRAFVRREDAEAFVPSLYLDPRFEAVWRDGAWRVVVRFWRPEPAAPVAASPRVAARAPLGLARTQAEAERLLRRSAELVEEAVGEYASAGRAEAARRKLSAPAAARLEARDGKYTLVLSYWRPSARHGPLGERDRSALTERAQAPLRPRAPQATPYVGLFERLAPENPAVILAEEGDGRGEGS